MSNPFTEYNMEFIVEDGVAMGAVFSPERTYRYTLMRMWNMAGDNMVSFVGLNPSTADETTDDPTVRRCINFAKRWGFDGMYMLNAFSFRATNPADMKAAGRPIGPENNHYIHEYANRRSELAIACWGNHGQHRNRSEFVISLINDPWCLGVNQTGEPKHPLYLAKDTPPRPYHSGMEPFPKNKEGIVEGYLQNLWEKERENYIS